MKNIIVRCCFAALHSIQTLLGPFSTAKCFASDRKRAYLVGTPEHDNLGDHAIALAELQFIKEYFSEYEIVEITVESWRKYRLNLLSKVRDDDIFFITGGGNMGNIYRLDEKLKRFIISRFKNNKVVVFPQTIYYSKDENGKKELSKTKKIYNAHPRLLICAREEISFSLMKEYFGKDRVLLCPDIVFSLKVEFKKNVDTDCIGICLREDFESALSIEKREEIIQCAGEKHQIRRFNTCLPHGISKNDREREIKILLESIAQNSLVITDRLHGIVFSVITRTPCIAYGGTSHKILSTKQWLNDSDALIVINHTDNLENMIQFVEKMSVPFDVVKFSGHYRGLAKRIQEI